VLNSFDFTDIIFYTLGSMLQNNTRE